MKTFAIKIDIEFYQTSSFQKEVHFYNKVSIADSVYQFSIRIKIVMAWATKITIVLVSIISEAATRGVL